MWEFLQTPTARLVELFAVLAVMIAVAVYIVTKVRAGLRDSDNDASDMLTKFREIHAKGDLSDEEFRTIKTHLADQLQDE